MAWDFTQYRCTRTTVAPAGFGRNRWITLFDCDCLAEEIIPTGRKNRHATIEADGGTVSKTAESVYLSVARNLELQKMYDCRILLRWFLLGRHLLAVFELRMDSQVQATYFHDPRVQLGATYRKSSRNVIYMYIADRFPAASSTNYVVCVSCPGPRK